MTAELAEQFSASTQRHQDRGNPFARRIEFKATQDTESKALWIKLNHHGREAAFETSLDNVSRMDKVISDTTSLDEPRLLMVDDVVNERLRTNCKALCD